MKNAIFLLFVAISVSATSQSSIEFPYNPDSNGDNQILLPDLLAFLPLFGNAFSVSPHEPSMITLGAEMINELDTVWTNGFQFQLEMSLQMDSVPDVLVFKFSELQELYSNGSSPGDQIWLDVDMQLPPSSNRMLLIATDQITSDFLAINMNFIDENGVEICDASLGSTNDRDIVPLICLGGLWFGLY